MLIRYDTAQVFAYQDSDVTKGIQAIRGMNDYLPADTVVWQQIEATLARILASYGYSEIRLPLIEATSLFKRAVGEVTDVVEKEMYTFADRNGESITLRPEGTAGCVRAGIEHGLLHNQQQKLWYYGPMFRYERPQKGRYRQFYQLGVEVFGVSGPDIDGELILLTARWWKTLGVAEHMRLELNSIGSVQARLAYRAALVSWLEEHWHQLDEDCQRRTHSNPLRVLDSKNPAIQALLSDAPQLDTFLDEESKTHFSELCALLTRVGIKFTINRRLVRGLDYYNRTVFEWITDSLGAQGTVCAGGRYDDLVNQLGGRATPAIGFALGMERLVLLVQAANAATSPTSGSDVYLIAVGSDAQAAAWVLTEAIRDQLPEIMLSSNLGGGNLSRQLARANKQRARVVMILGENEVNTHSVILKVLATGEQQCVAQADIVAALRALLVERSTMMSIKGEGI